MNQGYSLIELTVVMSIICLLSFLSYPSLCNYLAHTRRIDGQMALLDLASRMERYYSEHNTYQKASIHTGTNDDVLSTEVSPEGWYALSIINATDREYALQATALNTQALHDVCQTLTFNSLGIKGSMPSTVNRPNNHQDCWA